MFLITDKLNEGKISATKISKTKRLYSEGKSPKSIVTEAKLPGWKSVKSQSCVNSNWQKLRG
jgi:hypothetical protein